MKNQKDIIRELQAKVEAGKKPRISKGSICPNGNSFKVEFSVFGIKAVVKTFASIEKATNYLDAMIEQRNNLYAMYLNKTLEDSSVVEEAMRCLNGERIYFGGNNITGESIFSDYCLYFMRKYIKKMLSGDMLRASTAQNYIGYINNHIMYSNLGKVKLKEMSVQRIAEFVADIKKTKKLANKTISNIVRFVCQALNYALEEAHIDRMVKFGNSQLVRLEVGKIVHEKKHTYNQEQLKAIVERAYRIDIKYGVLFHIAAVTGMRRGEILGLKVKDIDFSNQIINVKRAVKREALLGEKGSDSKKTFINYNAPLKTKSSERNIKIDADTTQKLKELVDVIQSKNKDACIQENYLFATDTATTINPDSILNIFHRLSDECGFERIKFHEIRSSYATIQYKANVPIAEIQKTLGHTTVSMTMRYIDRSKL